MPREEDFSRIKRKPSKPKKTVSTMASPAEPEPSPPQMMPTPFSRVPIHEQFEKDLVRICGYWSHISKVVTSGLNPDV